MGRLLICSTAKNKNANYKHGFKSIFYSTASQCLALHSSTYISLIRHDAPHGTQTLLFVAALDQGKKFFPFTAEITILHSYSVFAGNGKHNVLRSARSLVHKKCDVS